MDEKLIDRLKDRLWNHPESGLRNDARFAINKLKSAWAEHNVLYDTNRDQQKTITAYRLEIEDKNKRLDSLYYLRDENEQLKVELAELKMEMVDLLRRENYKLMGYLSEVVERERRMRKPTLIGWLRMVLGY